jgi:hypothetical protein
MPAPSGVTPPTAVNTALWGKLRVPVLIASILFLLLAVASTILVPALQMDGTLPSPATELFVRHDPASRWDAERAYAARLRSDAERLVGQGDYENALVRLDQAAGYDRQGDGDAEIQRTRQKLQARIGEVTDLDHPAHGGPAVP